MYVSHMPGLLWGPVQQGKNDSSVGVETERHCHVRLHSGWQLSWRQAGSNPGHGGLGVQARSPLAPRQIILMSDISPFDKSWATGQRAEDVTAGNDEEWHVRKLINVWIGVKHLPLGVQSRADVWINEAVFASLFDQPANPRRLAAYKSVMRCLSPGSTSLPLFQASQSWMARLWYDSAGWHLGNCRELPPSQKNKRVESGGGQCFGEMISLIDAIYRPSSPTILLPLMILQVSSHI